MLSPKPYGPRKPGNPYATSHVPITQHVQPSIEGSSPLLNETTMDVLPDSSAALGRQQGFLVPWDDGFENARKKCYDDLREEFLLEIQSEPLSASQRDTLAEKYIKIVRRNNWLEGQTSTAHLVETEGQIKQSRSFEAEDFEALETPKLLTSTEQFQTAEDVDHDGPQCDIDRARKSGEDVEMVVDEGLDEERQTQEEPTETVEVHWDRKEQLMSWCRAHLEVMIQGPCKQIFDAIHLTINPNAHNRIKRGEPKQILDYWPPGIPITEVSRLNKLNRVHFIAHLLLLPLTQREGWEKLKEKLDGKWTDCMRRAVENIPYRIGHRRKNRQGREVTEDSNDDTTVEDVQIRKNAMSSILEVVSHVERMVEDELDAGPCYVANLEGSLKKKFSNLQERNKRHEHEKRSKDGDSLRRMNKRPQNHDAPSAVSERKRAKRSPKATQTKQRQVRNSRRKKKQHSQSTERPGYQTQLLPSDVRSESASKSFQAIHAQRPPVLPDLPSPALVSEGESMPSNFLQYGRQLFTDNSCSQTEMGDPGSPHMATNFATPALLDPGFATADATMDQTEMQQHWVPQINDGPVVPQGIQRQDLRPLMPPPSCSNGTFPVQMRFFGSPLPPKTRPNGTLAGQNPREISLAFMNRNSHPDWQPLPPNLGMSFQNSIPGNTQPNTPVPTQIQPAYDEGNDPPCGCPRETPAGNYYWS